MGIYFVSDLHLNHKNIIRYCGRPFKTVDEMNSVLIRNWNEVVSNDDTVYFLGDFALGPKDAFRRFTACLNGHKHFIIGNHDHISRPAIVDAGFETAQYRLELPELKLILTHHPEEAPEGWTAVYGHIHDKMLENPMKCRSVCVCVEKTDYRPISYDELMRRAIRNSKG